jgi:4-hydroxy-2-oxoglutarate aldolase
VIEHQRDSTLEKLHGILLPTTTNFNQDGSLDQNAFRFNLAKWFATNINGIVLLGSTGERVHLNEREYIQVIETARAEVQNDRVLIVGAGQQSTVGTIAEIQIAADAGADAVLVITPHFYRSAMSQKALLDFYNAIADASKVPVMLYSMPALTGIKIEPETIVRLSEHRNIIGVKDSSNDMNGFSETVKLCPLHFAVMTGNGTVLLDALKLGATGGILAVGCAVPETCLAVFRLFANGEVKDAELLQSKLTPFAAAVTTRFGIGGLKAAMDIAGYRGGPVRQPLSSPKENEVAEVAALLEELMGTFHNLQQTHSVNSI